MIPSLPKARLALGLLVAVACLACPQTPAGGDGGTDSGRAPDSGPPDAGAPDSGPGDSGTGETCRLDSGVSGGRDGGSTPFRYVFVLVKENHTVDSLYGAFPGVNGASTAVLSDGGLIPLSHPDAGYMPADLDHSHSAALIGWAHGAMNGFDLIREGHGVPAGLVFTQYTQADIPNYYAYAQTYALCDNLFTLTLADSFPGYVGLISATSVALGDPNCPGSCNWGCDAPPGTLGPTYSPCTCQVSQSFPCFNLPTVVDALPAGFTWRTYSGVYGGQLSSSFAAFQALYQGGNLPTHTRDNSELLTDLQAGDFANLTFIWGGNNSEHPPGSICPGENDTVQIANAIMTSSIWPQSLLIVTYDDWGGFYDHVAPPGPPCSSGELFSPGFRVPTLLISPYSRPGPFHEQATHASIDALIEVIFGMPPLANTNPLAQDDGPAVLLDAFDFSQPPDAGLILTPRTCP